MLVGIGRFDTRRDIPGYGEDDYFGPLVEDYLKREGGKGVKVGQAVSYMLDALKFKQHSRFWLESNLAVRS